MVADASAMSSTGIRRHQQEQRKERRIVQIENAAKAGRAPERPVDHMHPRIRRALARARAAVEHDVRASADCAGTGSTIR